MDRNKKNPSKAWNLRGLLIGNGWVSPTHQYPAYLQYAFVRGLVDKDSTTAQPLLVKQRICNRMLSTSPSHVKYPECEEILTAFLQITRTGSNPPTCYNMYDVRLRDTSPSCGMQWPPDLGGLTAYLRRHAVVSALHVSDGKNTGWEECRGAVGTAFRAVKSKPSEQLLPDLLNQVPILFYSGFEDLICNHVGTERMIDSLEWGGGKGFEVTPGNWAPRRTWTFEGDVAGFWQEARNLTYVLFYNSSHMVPFDHPRRTRDMLDRFMGVDISSIGGDPTDSRIDGEKGPETTVGGVSNRTRTVEETRKKIEAAKWAAYRRAGWTVLTIVAIAAAAWGYFIWRQRRKGAIYSALRGQNDAGRGDSSMTGLCGGSSGDIEAAAFDETSLDDLGAESPVPPGVSRYSIGDDSDGEEMDDLKPQNGSTKKEGDDTS